MNKIRERFIDNWEVIKKIYKYDKRMNTGEAYSEVNLSADEAWGEFGKKHVDDDHQENERVYRNILNKIIASGNRLTYITSNYTKIRTAINTEVGYTKIKQTSASHGKYFVFKFLDTFKSRNDKQVMNMLNEYVKPLTDDIYFTRNRAVIVQAMTYNTERKVSEEYVPSKRAARDEFEKIVAFYRDVHSDIFRPKLNELVSRGRLLDYITTNLKDIRERLVDNNRRRVVKPRAKSPVYVIMDYLKQKVPTSDLERIRFIENLVLEEDNRDDTEMAGSKAEQATIRREREREARRTSKNQEREARRTSKNQEREARRAQKARDEYDTERPLVEELIDSNTADIWKAIKYTLGHSQWDVEIPDKDLMLNLSLTLKQTRIYLTSGKLLNAKTHAMNRLNRFVQENVDDLYLGLRVRYAFIFDQDHLEQLILHQAIVLWGWSAPHAYREYVMYASFGRDINNNFALKVGEVMTPARRAHISMLNDTNLFPWKSRERDHVLRESRRGLDDIAVQYYKDTLHAYLPVKYRQAATEKQMKAQEKYVTACILPGHREPCSRTKAQMKQRFPHMTKEMKKLKRKEMSTQLNNLNQNNGSDGDSPRYV